MGELSTELGVGFAFYRGGGDRDVQSPVFYAEDLGAPGARLGVYVEADGAASIGNRERTEVDCHTAYLGIEQIEAPAAGM